MKILITGATGLVGKFLGASLSAQSHDIYIVSRKPNVHLPFSHSLIVGDLSAGVISELQGHSFDAVFHLMGETIAQRWTSAVKQQIFTSRVESTKNLILSLGAVKTLIVASAIGIYGERGTEKLSEESSLGTDFLSRVCQAWESAASSALLKFPDVRIVKMRFGLVLSEHGGAFPKLLKPIQYGVGGTIGDGNAIMSWIHLEDLVRMMTYVLNNINLDGPINAVSPEPVTNQYLTHAIASKLHRWAVFRIPKMVLKGVLGEMASVLIFSQNVSSEKIQQAGFSFHYPRLSAALDQLIKPS